MECCFSVKRKEVNWKDYMERVMNEECNRYHNVEGDAVEGSVVCACRDEVVQALNEMIIRKNSGPSDVAL